MLRAALPLTLSLIGQFTEAPLPMEPLRLGTVKDVSGRAVTLPDPKAKATVILFVTVDCPIANRYSPEIGRIVRDYTPKGAAFYLVYVDSASTAADVNRHRTQYGLKCPGILDAKHVLVRTIGARVTPQAAVLDRSGRLLYRGRIDDLYTEHSRMKDPPYRKDLRIALAQATSGKPVSVPQTPAIGCAIPDTLP